jgi:transposase
MLRPWPASWTDFYPISYGSASSRCYHSTTPPAWRHPAPDPEPQLCGPLIFMARTSTPWALLPAMELGCGSASTCWRRLDEWARAACSSSSRRCCWTNSVRPAASTWSGSVSTPSACGRSKGDLTGANPVDRGKQGSKLHLAGERSGLPLAVILSATNANDSVILEAVLDDIPPIRMPTGGAGGGPGRCMATRRTAIGAVGPTCAGGVSAHGSPDVGSSPRPGLAATAWTIERTGAWLGGFRRLRIRHERSGERFYALVMLACAIICFNALRQPPW